MSVKITLDNIKYEDMNSIMGALATISIELRRVERALEAIMNEKNEGKEQ